MLASDHPLEQDYIIFNSCNGTMLNNSRWNYIMVTVKRYVREKNLLFGIWLTSIVVEPRDVVL